MAAAQGQVGAQKGEASTRAYTTGTDATVTDGKIGP
jgi:hypothetical protein